jgi:tetraacyldisaccharide 4'-kinase
LFADHHRYRDDEIAAIVDAARATGADCLLTTEKDAVRIPHPPAGLPLRVLRIAAEIDDEPRFRQRLLSAARRAA